MVFGGLYGSELPNREKGENECCLLSSLQTTPAFITTVSWPLSKWPCHPSGDTDQKCLFTKPVHRSHTAPPSKQDILLFPCI